MDTMELDTMECKECGRLRAAYRRATRHELDLLVKSDQAAIRNDQARLEELRALLAGVTEVRTWVSQSVLDHEQSPHGSLISSRVWSEVSADS